MSDPALRVQGLGKRYRIGHRQPDRSLAATLNGVIRAPFRRLTSVVRPRGEGEAADDLWALKDVTFEVAPGEVIGLVGANGAGQTTLLKILSRITEPTEGHADIWGTVGALLEVGTGFHPELTGRENVYLNGAILGMRKAEIAAAFDEIVAFSEVERFLDTPVKRYSTGMYVRLAFSVAAHLNPDILVVDEVLSVGDASFRKKSLGKMSEVAGAGRTVLLVSHNMSAIKSLAQRVLWLDRGRLREIGDPRDVVNRYLAGNEVDGESGTFGADHLEPRRVRLPKYRGEMRLESVRLLDAAGQVTGAYLEDAEVFLELTFEVRVAVQALEIFVRVRTTDGQLVFTGLPGKRLAPIQPGRLRVRLRFGLSPLLPGVYQGDVILLSHLPQDNVSPAFRFEVIPDPQSAEDDRTVLVPGGAGSFESTHATLGLIRVRASWVDVERIDAEVVS